MLGGTLVGISIVGVDCGWLGGTKGTAGRTGSAGTVGAAGSVDGVTAIPQG